MKEEALALVAAIEDPTRGLNLLREYLQAFALRSLHESEVFTRIAFVGGTALRERPRDRALLTRENLESVLGG